MSSKHRCHADVVRNLNAQADDLARGKVIPGLFVGLLVETHDEMLEEITHLNIADAIRMQIDPSHDLHDGVETIAGIQLLNLVAELELLKDARCGL